MRAVEMKSAEEAKNTASNSPELSYEDRKAKKKLERAVQNQERKVEEVESSQNESETIVSDTPVEEPISESISVEEPVEPKLPVVEATAVEETPADNADTASAESEEATNGRRRRRRRSSVQKEVPV